MEYVRLIHPRDYNGARGRFNRTAFEPSSDDGAISLVQLDCVSAAGRSICAHIREYYPSVVDSDFIIFWKFDTAILPEGCRFEQVNNNLGDTCHHHLLGQSDNRARSILIAQYKDNRGNFFICRNGAHSPLNEADIDRMVAVGITFGA